MDLHESVWTHELRLAMPPQARSMRAFGELAEALDDLGGVRWRSMTAETAVLDLTESLWVAFSPTTMSFLSYRGTLGESVASALEVLKTVVNPPVVRLTTRSQHLIPIAAEYEVATTQAARRWLGLAALGSDPLDCAVLLDGDPADFRAHFQVEYGVVGSSEVSQRLLRTAGRAAKVPDAPRPPDYDTYPEVSVFADFTWRMHGPIRQLAGPEGCLASAIRTADYACDFVAARAAEVVEPIEGES